MVNGGETKGKEKRRKRVVGEERAWCARRLRRTDVKKEKEKGMRGIWV